MSGSIIAAMSQLADNLRVLMLKEGLNPNSLAEASGAKQSTVFRILEGIHKSPRDSTLVPLANFFRISVEELRYGKLTGDNVEPAPQRHGVTKRPLISYVQAGEFTEAIDVYAAGYAEDWVEAPSNIGKHSFWLRVKGDSMTAPVGLSIPENMLILVDPEVPPTNGCLVVAKVGNDVTFKKLALDAGKRYLKPLNPAFPVIEVTGELRIVGVVREAKHVF